MAKAIRHIRNNPELDNRREVQWDDRIETRDNRRLTYRLKDRGVIEVYQPVNSYTAEEYIGFIVKIGKHSFRNPETGNLFETREEAMYSLLPGKSVKPTAIKRQRQSKTTVVTPKQATTTVYKPERVTLPLRG